MFVTFLKQLKWDALFERHTKCRFIHATSHFYQLWNSAFCFFFFFFCLNANSINSSIHIHFVLIENFNNRPIHWVWILISAETLHSIFSIRWIHLVHVNFLNNFFPSFRIHRFGLHCSFYWNVSNFDWPSIWNKNSWNIEQNKNGWNTLNHISTLSNSIIDWNIRIAPQKRIDENCNAKRKMSSVRSNLRSNSRLWNEWNVVGVLRCHEITIEMLIEQ